MTGRQVAMAVLSLAASWPAVSLAQPDEAPAEEAEANPDGDEETGSDEESEPSQWAPIEVSAGPSEGEDDAEPTDDAADKAPSGDGDDDGYLDEPDAPPPEPEEVTILGQRDMAERLTGSAFKVDDKELQRFEDDDVHRILQRVPGVYVRGEDGYGLRPNIGLRGANSERSSKVALMEDGVLLGPAPYAAPAAYYFPLVTRMTAVEVFKGPSGIQYGPNTIGGAINFVSRGIPYGHRLGIDAAAGTEQYRKGHLHYGYGTEHWGFMVEGVQLQSTGFKELDAPDYFGNEEPDTGFSKSEVIAKFRVNTSGGDVFSRADIKLGYARELSNETYLGLTDEDFRNNPYRRYAGSQLDRMEWDRTLIEISQNLLYKDVFSSRITLYRHDFHRAWFKLNRFAGSDLESVLSDPTTGQRQVYYDVLRGAADSSTDDEALLVGTNDRTYYSQGIQLTGKWDLPALGPVEQRLRFGARWHNDQIERLHTEDDFFMQNQALVAGPLDRATTTDNRGSAVAFSGHLIDEIAISRLIVAPGVRVEYITTDFVDDIAQVRTEGEQRVLLPGVGVLYQVIAEKDALLSVLGGVHQGFSPVAPGQPDNIKPEVSVNYELGARGRYEWANGELIGFYSDYSNLTGDCTFSSGCQDQQVGEQFNGGEAAIYGLEASTKADIPAGKELTFPATASYTFTQTELLTSFSSGNPQWGDVQAGDELPYVPKHQLALTAGALWDKVGGINFGFTFTDAMRESASQGEPAEGEETDPYAVVDASAHYWVLEQLQVYAKIVNLLDNEYLVSRRPFGARPGRPRFFFAGLKLELDSNN